MNAVADMLVIALVFATFAQAWSWLGSYGGIVSFGHAVFFGIGGYAVAVSNLRGGSPWYGALGGALFAVLVAAVCGTPLLGGRVRAMVFSALTLAGGIAAEPFVAAHHWVGPGNVFAFPVQRGFLNLQFDARWPYVALALAVFAAAQGLTFALRGTRTGYYLRALRTNAAAARGAGIAARPPRLLALTVSAFVTSVAGSLYAEFLMGVDPARTFGFGLSLDVALAALIAGPRWAWGAPLAGGLYALLAAAVPLHPAGTAGTLVWALEIVAIVALSRLRPEGLFDGMARRRQPAVAGSAA